MKPVDLRRVNWALIATILFSATCWAALYAVWADLGPEGYALIQDPDSLKVAEGAALVALHAFGVLFLLGVGLGTAALLARPATAEPARHRPHQS
jgi:hypothetical protein